MTKKIVGTDSEKEMFLKEFGDDYGYPTAPKNIYEIRSTEFKRLLDSNRVYLDHAGATLYSELQMEAVCKDLTSNVYGNPHSQSDSSFSTSEIVRKAREQVLDFCNASHRDYKCIFTSGATAALKLVGEAFPWSNQSTFMYTMENHNSVLGIREYALSKGATAIAVDVEESAFDTGVSGSLSSSIKVLRHPIQRRKEAILPPEELIGDVHNLFAFPSECNFSGMRFSLDLVNIIKGDSERILERGNWKVLIDAAKGCVTKPPDLSKYPADFVVLSFYKMFGYPTGLGALIVSNEAAKLLKKNYFSGGTVAASIADIDFFKRREGVEEFFEDGTMSFLSIASLQHGFKILRTLTVSSISRHMDSLANYVRRKLATLRHGNCEHVCVLYGKAKSKVLFNEPGSVVSFNVRRPDASWFGHHEVEKLASLSGIQLRTGCFCNPGACAKYLGLSHLDLVSNIQAGHICWDDQDVINGKPSGAVRVSFGYMSTFEDAKKFIDFIVSSFVSLSSPLGDISRTGSIPYLAEEQGKVIPRYYLKSIIVYPIKSCAGFSVNNWPLSDTGLLHDREWVLKSLNGEILTQKKVPDMRFINTFIDFESGMLLVESPHCKAKLQIGLLSDPFTAERDKSFPHQGRYNGQHYNDEVDSWFSSAIGRPCTLERSISSNERSCMNKARRGGNSTDMEAKLNFVNEAQFLLISEASISELNNRIDSNISSYGHGPRLEVDSMRFRPNLLISGGEPYAEDGWKSLKIKGKKFQSVGGCNRCQMINLDPQAGLQKSPEPLATLASYRRMKGKILFGILLRYEGTDAGKDKETWLETGVEVHPRTD
ncbi:molybdenum cofactor sulfurase isoform X2 [Impatiens glandulifera]|uniref:molybdenum cofactor sulfurase isoform X2 n=1 Tax=Impatiens glandulifera TaxID=253017 RepID=UPI001FB146F3|nr:molybdenum cofactor sulfurase isoform X2 [Impatiens glandulifera]